MTDNQPSRPLRRSPAEPVSKVASPGGEISICEKLKNARQTRGIDLYRAERDTKIRVKYLQALECGDFAQLPAEVYARGFLRNYASYLGLDPDVAEAEWRRGDVRGRNIAAGHAELFGRRATDHLESMDRPPIPPMRTPTAPAAPAPAAQPGSITITLPTLAGLKSFFARATGAANAGQAAAPTSPAETASTAAPVTPAEAETPPPPVQTVDAAAAPAAAPTASSSFPAAPVPANGKDAAGTTLVSRVARGRAKKAAIKARRETGEDVESSNGHTVEIAGADVEIAAAGALALSSPVLAEAFEGSTEGAAEETPLLPDSAEIVATGASPLAQTATRVRAMAAALPGMLRRSPAAAREDTFVGPRPVQRRSRSLQLQPIHLILLGMMVLIVAAGLFWANQAQKVVQDPSLFVTSPSGAVLDVAAGTTSYTLKGTATPNTEIDVSIDGRSPMTAQTDANGNWSYGATLHNGPNLFEIQSRDLQTNHFSQAVSFVINVPVPTASPGPMQVLVTSPTSGQVFKDGNVTITGSTVGIASLTITPTYLGAAPVPKPTPTVNPLATPTPVRTPSPTPTRAPTAVPTVMPTVTPTLQAATAVSSPTPTPKPTPLPSGGVLPVNAIPTIDGKFTATLHLYSGRWQLTVVGSDKAGLQATPVQVNIVVQAGSLVVVIDVRGGPVDLKVWRDGRLYIPQTRYPWGSSVKVIANQSVWVFTGIPYHTFITVNGSYYGALGSGNKAASWRITGSGPPTPSNDR